MRKLADLLVVLVLWLLAEGLVRLAAVTHRLSGFAQSRNIRLAQRIDGWALKVLRLGQSLANLGIRKLQTYYS